MTTLVRQCMYCRRTLGHIDGQGQTGTTHGVCRSRRCEEQWARDMGLTVERLREVRRRAR